MTSTCTKPVEAQDQEEEELQKDTTCQEILVMTDTTTTDLLQTMACVKAAQESLKIAPRRPKIAP